MALSVYLTFPEACEYSRINSTKAMAAHYTHVTQEHLRTALEGK
jgi:hypothetical protein